MTFEKLSEYLLDLQNIATDKTSIAGEQARKLLQKDVIAHNVQEIESLVNRYFENR